MRELVYIFPFTVSRKKKEKNVARVNYVFRRTMA